MDGEIVASRAARPASNGCSSAPSSTPIRRLLRTVPVFYYIFDVMRADGRDVRLCRPRAQGGAAGLLTYGDRCGSPCTGTPGRGVLRRGQRSGWEGLIAKRAAARYTAGRSRDWLKFKAENNQEFVIGGYTDPQGSRRFGALLIGYYDEDGKLAYAARWAPVSTSPCWRACMTRCGGAEQPQPPFGRGALPRSGVHWVRPELVGQVGLLRVDPAGQLRHPRFLGLRDDKAATEVVREVPT